MPDNAAIKQLQADVARILLSLADLRQAADGWPALAARMEDNYLASLAEVSGKFDQALEQQAHIIGQNDTLVRWATDDGDDTAWLSALRGISALVERQDRQAATQIHVEAGLAAIAGRLDAIDTHLSVHDSHVADRVDRAGAVQTRAILGARRFGQLAAVMSALTLLFVVVSMYIMLHGVTLSRLGL